MLLKVYAVYDSKVGLYNQPFFQRSKGEALRGFQEVANNPESMICRHPADYTLFEIAEYDEEKGLLSPHNVHQNLGLALEFKREAPEQLPMFANKGAS